MMPVILAGLNFLTLLLLVVSAISAWVTKTPEAPFAHMYWGVATSLLGLFAHSFTMFFFIGTGKAIKEMCKDHEAAWPFIARSRSFKMKIYGKAMLAILMLIIQPVIGAAVYSGRLNSHWHLFGFFVTLAVQAWAFGVELKYLGLNNVLMAEITEWKETGVIGGKAQSA